MRTFMTLLLTMATISTAQVRSAEPAAGKQVEQELKTADNKSILYLL